MENDFGAYEVQLRAVEQALKESTDPKQIDELEALKASILELLELANGSTNVVNTEFTSEDGSKNEARDEMELFMAEVKAIERENSKKEAISSDEDVKGKLKELQIDLEKMVGQKCSAPHLHSWGVTAYHNALVCGIDDTVEVDSNGTLEPTLRVLFINPTHREMLPCAYYLEGECRYDEERCHFSHGEKVTLTSLREYIEPNFTRLARNCVVLAKQPDRLWYRGRVLCANFIEKHCRVLLDGKEHKEREKDYAFEDLFPIFHDDELSSDSSSDQSCETDSETELNDVEIARRAALVQESLFSFQPTQALGEWERHTKGIGSKLMAKMGYIHGTGLGSEGKGIVIPISAQILPQGRSLDYCMELREAANGDKDLFSVERKMRKQKKKQEALNTKAYEREVQRVDVFSFLNDNIFTNQKAANTDLSANGKKKSSNLQEQSNKSLNIDCVRIADDIRRKQRDILKIQESLTRNANSSEVCTRLQAQLNLMKQELRDLQNEEKNLTTEQTVRKTKNKLSVF